jgi:hypothetical protein
MTGATVLPWPTPKAPARFVTKVLLPAPVPLVTVNPQDCGEAIDVTTIDAVPVVGLVMAEVARACVTVTPLTVSVAVFVISVKHAALSELVRETVAPYSKPEPNKATAKVPVAAAAEGVTFSRPLPTVNDPAPEVPPSVLVTVTANAPDVAAAEFAGFVGVTLKTIEVALTEVTDDVNDVPSVPFAKETVAPVAKLEPVMVTVVGPVPSQTELGLIELITGVASRVTEAVALEPLASVKTTVQVVPAVPVAAKLAVPVPAPVSATDVKVKLPVPQVATNVSLVAPLLAKPEPVNVAVPEALLPVALVAAP